MYSHHSPLSGILIFWSGVLNDDTALIPDIFDWNSWFNGFGIQIFSYTVTDNLFFGSVFQSCTFEIKVYLVYQNNQPFFRNSKNEETQAQTKIILLWDTEIWTSNPWNPRWTRYQLSQATSTSLQSTFNIQTSPIIKWSI